MPNIAVLEKKLKKIPTDQLYQFAIDEQGKLGLSDLYYFNKNILGYKDMEPRPHLGMCEFIRDWKKQKKVLVAPRKTFKSTMNTVGETIREIIANPAINILIVGEVHGNAATYLKEIKLQFQGNQKLRTIYAQFFRDYEFDVWRDEAINLIPKGDKKRADDQLFTKENTIDIAGIGTSKVGMHYDKIIIVDPHSEKNVNTGDQIRKVIDYYRLTSPILKKGGRLIIETTRWHYLDIVNHVLTKEPGQFEAYIHSCYNEDGSLYFPEHLDEEMLRKERETLGSYFFSCHYLCQPQSDETKVFKPENARFYKEADLPKEAEGWIIVDPSISEKENADDFAALALKVDRRNNTQYCRGGQRITRKLPAQAVAELMAMLEEIFADEPINRVAIETVAYQRIYKFELERELAKRKKPFQVIELKPGKRAKKARITGLQPFYENGKMLFREGVGDSQSPDFDIIMQLSDFPVNTKDDFIDAWAYILDVLNVKREETTEQKNTRQFESRMKLINRTHKQSYLKRRYN